MIKRNARRAKEGERRNSGEITEKTPEKEQIEERKKIGKLVEIREKRGKKMERREWEV